MREREYLFRKGFATSVCVCVSSPERSSPIVDTTLMMSTIAADRHATDAWTAFGLSVADAPLVVIHDTAGDRKFRMERSGKLTRKGISQFLRDYLDQKLVAWREDL